MNKVFDIDELPERRLQIRKMISLNSHLNIGATISFVKQDMAQQLATKIIEGEPFFWSQGDNIANVSILEYGADCIVMTREEFLALKRKSFTEGVEYSRGFMDFRPF